MFKKIKFWFWWNFQATSVQKLNWDVMTTGVCIRKMFNSAMKYERIDPKKFFIDPNGPNTH